MAATAIHHQPTTTIKLSGSLAQKFGRLHPKCLDSGRSWEVFKALKNTIPGFEEEIKRLDRLGMRFAIFRNGKNATEKEFELSGTREIRIVPVITGGKRAGSFQTVIGAVLIVVGAVVTAMGGGAVGVPMMKMGAVIAVGGIIQMLSPQAGGLKTSAAPENTPGYAFGSAKNTTASGNPVPLCIGKRRVGGAIISAAIYAEDQM